MTGTARPTDEQIRACVSHYRARTRALLRQTEGAMRQRATCLNLRIEGLNLDMPVRITGDEKGIVIRAVADGTHENGGTQIPKRPFLRPHPALDFSSPKALAKSIRKEICRRVGIDDDQTTDKGENHEQPDPEVL